jgi:hypothetical protein
MPGGTIPRLLIDGSGSRPEAPGRRIMAENDCTPQEIAAVRGHRTLKEVERYTHAADRKRLAARAQAEVAAACNVVPLAVVGAEGKVSNRWGH